MKLTTKEYYNLLTNAVKGHYGNEIGQGHPEDRFGWEVERDAVLGRLREEKRVALLVDKACRRAARKPLAKYEPDKKPLDSVPQKPH